MIKGLGTDILKVSRFKNVLDKHPNRLVRRLFTDEEREYSSRFNDKILHLAGRFCAKEAVSKALGTGFGEQLSFKDIWIVNDPNGKPIVFLSNRAKKKFQDPQIEVSISHCKEYATATAIWY
jgi:holo-[acyl-carrier protein] synthase